MRLYIIAVKQHHRASRRPGAQPHPARGQQETRRGKGVCSWSRHIGRRFVGCEPPNFVLFLFFMLYFYALPFLLLVLAASSPSFFLVAGRAKALLSPPDVAFQRP